MTEAERVLAQAAEYFHAGGKLSFSQLKAKLEPYLPKPEPDPLTEILKPLEQMVIKDAAKFAVTLREGLAEHGYIIAREVAAAEPSDEALMRLVECANSRPSSWTYSQLRAGLKGKAHD